MTPAAPTKPTIHANLEHDQHSVLARDLGTTSQPSRSFHTHFTRPIRKETARDSLCVCAPIRPWHSSTVTALVTADN